MQSDWKLLMFVDQSLLTPSETVKVLNGLGFKNGSKLKRGKDNNDFFDTLLESTVS